MNLKDLNNIDIKDLKNIDWSQIKERLQSQPDLLVTICLAVATVFVVYSTYTGYAESVKTAKKKTQTLQKRLTTYEKLQSAQKQQRALLAAVPKAINSDQLIQTFSELAIKHNIKILSSSPAEKQSNPLLSVTSVQMTVASKRYEDLILFVHDIETSPYPIRIKNWSGEFVSTIGALLQGSTHLDGPILTTDLENDYIKATVTIESVELMNV